VRHGVEQIAHALDVGAVDALRRGVRAAGVQEKQAPRVLAGVEQAVGVRVDENAAAGVAGADQVRMAVPDIRRIEPLPRLRDERVVGERLGQLRPARIPETLLRPEAPGSAGAERGDSQAG
jgi:hypothetical protein